MDPLKEKFAILKAAAHNKLLNFCQLVDPVYEAAYFHEVLADILERALQNTIEKKKTRIILTIPPRHGKTQTTSIYFPAWALGKYPTLKFILSSYGADLSEKVGMKTRDVINSEKYQTIFPGVTLRQDSKSKTYWMTKQNGSYFAVGIGGPVTGEGAGIILIDDPHKNREEAESETQRDNVYEYYKSTLYSRLEGAGTVILLMQRWHDADLVGRLLEDDADRKKQGLLTEDWEVINFPAIAEEDEVWNGQVIRKQGEALWPSKFPLSVLENIREVQGVYNWSCTPEETPILMADWTQKKISEIKPGDEVVGFKLGTKNTKRQLVKSKVLNVFSKIDSVYDYEMESGRKVRCTKDHKWFSGRNDVSHKPYKIMNKGQRLMFVCPTEEDMTLESDWRYFAGLVDGEGGVGKACLSLHQSPGANPSVFNSMKNIIDKLNLSYKLYEWERENPKWKSSACFNIHNTFDVYRKLIRIGKCGKSDQCAKRLFDGGHGFVKEEDKITNVTFSKKEPVYAIETETGNYIAWGYASSNSQYMQNPILAENQEFKKEFFKYYQEQDLENKYLKYYTFIDPAISQKKSADNTVVLTVAKEVNGPNFYRIREDAGKFTPQQTIDLIFKHFEEYRSEIYLETIAYQKALKFSIEEEQKIRGKYFRVNETKSGNKELRIRGLLPMYERGVIYHKHSDVEYERELLSFPRGRHDDRVDCLAFLTDVSDLSTSGRKAKQFYPHLDNKPLHSDSKKAKIIYNQTKP